VTAGWGAADVVDQSGRTAVVTGASSGIGFEVATVLAARRATVVLACRDQGRARAAEERILDRSPGASVEIVVLDLADLASVRAGAAMLRGRFERIDLLVNNAGVLMPAPFMTVDGFEGQWATNHLGHFALTGLLLDRLRAGPASRIVSVTSVGHVIGRLDPDDLVGGPRRGDRPPRSRLAAYAGSKLANLVFAYELQRRLATAGASTISVAAHPGSARTDIDRHIPWIRRALAPAAAVLQQPAARGALAVLRAATDPAVQGGRCYGPRGVVQWRGSPVEVRSGRRAEDPEVGRRLWIASERSTGVVYDLGGR
jgi:NAD(P)-dependent dehydrogenase (short-subunit alcohol dehydrogenase family)